MEINKNIDKSFAKIVRKLLNTHPSPRDEFDICVVNIKNRNYLCVKANNRWYLFPQHFLDKDDHTQYVLANGTREMIGNLAQSNTVCTNNSVVCNDNEVITI